MKVCDVTQFYSPVSGGVKRYLSEKQAFLERKGGHEHVLIIPGEKTACLKQGIRKVYTIKSPQLESTAGYRFLWNLNILKEILREERPDIIESGDPYQVGWTIAKLAAEFNWKAVAFYHSHFPEANLGFLKKYVGVALNDFIQDYAQTYVQRLYSRFDQTLVPSPSLQKILQGWGVNNAVNVKLGVDIDHFLPAEKNEALRRSFGIKPNRRILLHVGRLAPEKNTLTLLGAFEKLVSQSGKYHLILVGDGPLRKEVFDCSQRTQALTWQSYVKDSKTLASFYHAADLFVHPGIYETFGLVTLEAQACGLPVVGIQGNFMDRLAFGSLAYWAKENSPAALAEAIETISHTDLKKLGLQAAEKVREEYSWDQVFTEIFQIYQKVYESSNV